MSLNSRNGFGATKPLPQDDYEITKDLLAFVKTREGFRPIAELDTLAKPPVLTIGYGDTFLVHKGQVISESAASDRLKRNLEHCGDQVCRMVRVPLTTGQFKALVDFTYNLGAGAVEHSTLILELSRLNYRAALREFPKWNKAGGIKRAGLLSRRYAECDWFAEGEPELLEIVASLRAAEVPVYA